MDQKDQEKCECGMPLTDENRCSCEPTKCAKCCSCGPDCTCGCKQKSEKKEE